MRSCHVPETPAEEKRKLSVRACTSLGPTKREEGLEIPGLLNIYTKFTLTSTCGSWLYILYSIFKSYAHVAEMPTRA